VPLPEPTRTRPLRPAGARPLTSLATSAAAHGAVIALAFVALRSEFMADEDGGPTRRTALLTFRPEERVEDTTPADARVETERLERVERDPTEDVDVEPLEVAEPAPAPAPLPPPPTADPRRFDGAPAARVARRSGATNLDLGPRERVAEAEAPAPPPTEPATEAPPVEAEPAPPSEVASSPSPLPGSCPPPPYPRRAERLGWEGTVVLEIDVAADGTVADARIAESSGHGLLDEAALRAVRGWRFTPAKDAAGEPVPMGLRKPIEFRLP